MKLISLNTWGGRVYESFIKFVEKYRDTVDVFCLQEVDNNPAGPLEEGERGNFFAELEIHLPNHAGHFAPQIPGVGMAIFVSKNLQIADTGYRTILATQEMQAPFHPRLLQHVSISEPALSIYNFHGVPKSDKLDTSERKVQTERILEVLEKDTGSRILVGDFNLKPETQSLKSFEKNLRNLVKEGKFPTTRSSLYPYQAVQPFADYAFVTPDITLNDFQVLPDVVSDHLPLLIEFDVR